MLIHTPIPFFVQCLLLPCQAECLFSLLFLLCIFRKTPLAYNTLLFAAFCIVVNVALKVTWQIPAHTTTTKGNFAFPSGHMQYSTVFYGWITYHLHTDRWERLKKLGQFSSSTSPLAIYLLYTGLMLIFFCIGYGLVAAGYHSIIDVVGGWVVGTVLVASLGWIEITMPRYVPLLIGCLASACMLYIHYRYTPIRPHAWWSYATTMLLCVLYIPYHRRACSSPYKR